MSRPRVIPFLLSADGGLVKTVKFGKRRYVGDAINAVRIFNEKEVDELVLLDIEATASGDGPQFAYVEEVVLNSVLAEQPGLITEASRAFGSQSIVASLDVKRDLIGRRRAYTRGGTRAYSAAPLDLLRRWEDLGAGEVVVNSIDRDGMRQGLDLEFVQQAAAAVGIPVVAVGGAGDVQHLVAALRAGASAVGAGSMFVFHGVHQAVLLSYVDRQAFTALEAAFAPNTTTDR